MTVQVLCHECLEYFTLEDPFSSETVVCPVCGNNQPLKTGVQSSGTFVYYLDGRGESADDAESC
jgi:rRNA maturation endonuclease Nob1